MTDTSRTHDPSKARRERFALRLPSDPDQARSSLMSLREWAGVALTVLHLNDRDLDAWARQDWDALSPEAVAATDALEDLAPTAYRDALDVVEEESQHLMEGAPPPREEVGGGTCQRHVLFSNEEDLEDFLADAAMPSFAAAEWCGVSDAKLKAALSGGELPFIEYRERRLVPKRGLCRYLAMQLDDGQSPQDGRG